MAKYDHDPEFCYKVRERISKFRDQFKENIDHYHQMNSFVMGAQWEDTEQTVFINYNKVPLTANKLGVLANHLCAEQIQNTPNLQIFPGPGVSPKTAEVRAALIKDISLNSDAKTVYQTAFSQATIGGFGAFRVDTEYENDYSFFQQIKIHHFTDPTKCYWDLSSQSPCKTDGMFCGYVERMSRKKFKAEFGKDLESKIGSSSISDDINYTFADDDSISIIHDYERVGEKTTIYKLSDPQNSSIDKDEFKSLQSIEVDGEKFLIYKDAPVLVLEKRDIQRYKVKHRMIAGDYKLAEEDFPSRQLPILFVDHKSHYDKTGKQLCRSFFDDAKDSQRFLNYLITQCAYLLKTMRYDQFMAPRKTVGAPDTQEIWKNPAQRQGVLTYDEVPSGAKPEPIMPGELSGSLMQQYERCVSDIQTSTGMYMAQMGQQGNEVSGDAIDARAARGSYNIQIPQNSINIAITCLGQIVDEMIPSVYDTERTLTLSTSQNENEPVTINKQVDDYGSELENDMTKGNFSIRLLPGPSYEGQKRQALDSVKQVLAANPETFQYVADLFVENLPFPNTIELRNRLRTMVPPEIIEAGKTGKPLPPQPPKPDPMIELKKQELQFKAQDAQQKSMIKQQELQIKQAELQRKALETHQDMTMEWEKIEAQKQEEAARLEEEMMRVSAEIHRTNTDAEMSHAQNIVQLLTHAHKPESVGQSRG